MDFRARKDKRKQVADRKSWISSALGVATFLPGFFAGIFVGLMFDLSKGRRRLTSKEDPPKEKKRRKPAEIIGGVRRGSKAPFALRGDNGPSPAVSSEGGELKMVLVVRLDLKMGSGKIASQCAHAAVGTVEECMSRGQRHLLKRWEDCGQPKIVVTCSNQKEMNELRAKAESISLPVFTVADAGRTQIAAGSNTVLAIGPGVKSSVDSVTRHLKLL